MAPDNLEERCRTLQEFDCGNSRVIRIAKCRYEYGVYPAYEVLHGQNVLIELMSLTAHLMNDFTRDRDLTRSQYVMLTSQDQQTVAILPKDDPYNILVLHNFVSGESWPHDFWNYAWEDRIEGRHKRQLLLEQFEQEHPEIRVQNQLHEAGYLKSRIELDLADRQVRGA